MINNKFILLCLTILPILSNIFLFKTIIFDSIQDSKANLISFSHCFTFILDSDSVFGNAIFSFSLAFSLVSLFASFLFFWSFSFSF